jgi:fermentation-respiration switch protein FrsA (DUF1100 family)
MQLFPASERVTVRFGAIVAITAGAMAFGVLLLLALYAGTSTESARSSSGDGASASLPVVDLPRVAPSAPQTAGPVAAPQAVATPASAVANGSARETSPAASGIQPNQSTPLDGQLLFFPRKYPGGDWKPHSLPMEDAWFQSADGTKLHGWYLSSDKPKAVILYLHGNGGNITYDAVVYRFLKNHLNATTLAFDYRGYGRSEGSATIDGVLADAQAARAWLAQKAGVPETEVVLMGRSLGGAVAVQLAGDIAPRALILENTFSSLRALARYHQPNLAQLVPIHALNSSAILSRVDVPLLQCHADADRTVPLELGEDLFRAAKGPKEFFRAAGVGHNDQFPDEYYGKVMEFAAGLK